MDLKKHIRSIQDYPKKGILFRDITTLIKSEEAFKECIDQMSKILVGINFDKIASIESRGFIFASPLSYNLSKPNIFAWYFEPSDRLILTLEALLITW